MESIKQRISKRYKTEKSRQELKRVTGDSVKDFIKGNTNFLATLRNICDKDKRCDIVNTINKPPKEVAKQIVKILN